MGQSISVTSPVQANQGGFNALVLNYFDYYEPSPGDGQCRYFAFPESWNSRTDGLVGFRLQSDEGTHYAWVRFTRTDLEPSTPFQIAGYDWNPVVGAPIEAGLPPPPPPVQFQVLPEGLLLGWDYRFTGLVLECADSLTEPVEWRPVEGVEGNQIILPPDEASRFYRLRRP